jgi:hypothetical protein
MNDFELAMSIAACPEVQLALRNASHPCHKVVREQNQIIDVDLNRQRPEPWVGSLSTAKLLFLSSNPSISDDLGTTRENFPTYAWTDEDSADFFVNRYNPNVDPVHVTFRHPSEPDFLTRSFDGEYRNGLSNPKKSQPTWKQTHARAIELLGEEAHPHFDYAITEIVHCKSKDARGVAEASSLCIEKWLKQIFQTSTAPVVIALGSKVRDFFLRPVLGFDANFGLHKGYKLLSAQERALRDIRLTDFGGRIKLVVFNWHPTAMELKPLNQVYGPKVTKWLSQILLEDVSIPKSNEDLELTIREFF